MTNSEQPAGPGGPLLELDGVKQHYPLPRRMPFAPRKSVRALDGVDLTVRGGETLGVIGESGCGKSTLARVIAGLDRPTEGRVLFRGQDINALRGAERKEMRRNIQLIFQDPFSALNPRKKVGELVAEPFRIHRNLLPSGRRRAKVAELMELVGLKPEHMNRYPHQFSGGQQQRIGIARGIALNPDLLVCDEAVSALDVSVRAQIVNLLQDLQRELDLSFVFIAHDLQIVRHMADRVATMYLGRVVELGDYSDVYDTTGHPYTKALLAAAPELRGGPADRERIILTGDPPSPIDPPSGCRFRSRCWMAEDICREREPELVELAGAHVSRCHFADTLIDRPSL
ncbi:ABC transporter ATP-binding protein [Spelaeicoccus albus]|uniref:Oligopeptide transport system ATP-binding protein n=1 Tax=Spelaeicoccus albus TaxID=1280376 RepID=A0A7Z0D4T9_9MICO|nr:dipeptide ABC transporter ATP-binding protein [Spelaeicoccus albus]NYI68874.1 oligopeptide transport system ATP-binding protein [Spelaeicoccus albus]